MTIFKAELFRLKIPFKLGFSHSKADRFFSDSIILRLEGRDSGGTLHTGYGEAVIREYVSGQIDGETSGNDAVREAFCRLLKPFQDREPDSGEVLSMLRAAEPPVTDLPLLCAVETALLDILCSAEQTDIYELLDAKPVRAEIVYSGTLPLLPQPAAEKLLSAYKQMGITSLRIKIGKDPDYNRGVIELAHRVMGEGYDLKVDANAGWSIRDAEINIPLLKELGISIVEEPFGREQQTETSMIKKAAAAFGDDIVFMADESALTAEDLRTAAENKTFRMANIRLAKNGGLLKALAMAEEAEKLGIRYMSGCHVGETGILSAAGRVAASVMKSPEYIDGSYDAHLLSGNITAEDLSFGPGGLAGIIRGKRIGFDIDKNKIEEFTDEKIRCF